MKFKVGDTVRVREDLKVDNCYDGCLFTSNMCKYKGEIFSIIYIDFDYKRYMLDTGEDWRYSEEMLEPVEVETYEMYIDRTYIPNKQPEQVLKEQVQQIADENEQNCGNCKKCNTDYDCPSKCKDFDKWEADEPCNTNQIVEDYSDKIKESLEPSQLANKLKTTQLEKYKSLDKIEKFKLLQEEELELYKIKNAKYGDSFGISVHKYGLISALTRMSDKWNRIENLILSGDNGTDDESLIDSLRDLSNYANMTIIELEDME